MTWKTEPFGISVLLVKSLVPQRSQFPRRVWMFILAAPASWSPIFQYLFPIPTLLVYSHQLLRSYFICETASKPQRQVRPLTLVHPGPPVRPPSKTFHFPLSLPFSTGRTTARRARACLILTAPLVSCRPPPSLTARQDRSKYVWLSSMCKYFCCIWSLNHTCGLPRCTQNVSKWISCIKCI